MIGMLDHFRSLRDSTGGSAALTSRTHCLSWRCEVCREAPPSTHKTSMAFLELLLTGLDIIHAFVVVVIFILVAATERSVSLPLLGLVAASSPAGIVLA